MELTKGRRETGRQKKSGQIFSKLDENHQSTDLRCSKDFNHKKQEEITLKRIIIKLLKSSEKDNVLKAVRQKKIQLTLHIYGFPIYGFKQPQIKNIPEKKNGWL